MYIKFMHGQSHVLTHYMKSSGASYTATRLPDLTEPLILSRMFTSLNSKQMGNHVFDAVPKW